MKHKMIALILALTVMTWAQTATQTAPAAPQQSTAPAEKGKCPCCDKMAKADTSGAPACCAKHSSEGKETASCCAGKDEKSCCAGKDAKACMRNTKDKAACCTECGKDKTVATCCGGKCGRDCGKECCSSVKAEKTASNCCAHDLRAQNKTTRTFAEAAK